MIIQKRLKIGFAQSDNKGNIQASFTTKARIGDAQVSVQWGKALTVDLIKDILGVDVLTKKPSPTGAYAKPLLKELERKKISLVIE